MIESMGGNSHERKKARPARNSTDSGLGNAVRAALFLGVAAVPMFGDALPADAETLFKIGADGRLATEATVTRGTRAAEKKLLEEPRIQERIGEFRKLFMRGNFPDAMRIAQSISDFYWSKNHQDPHINALGRLEYESNGVEFVKAPVGCVNNLGGRAFSFLGRDQTGSLHSILPAHAITPATTTFTFTPRADVATQPRPMSSGSPCIELAETSVDAHFKLGVILGAEQLAGVIFPLKPFMDAGIRIEVDKAQARVPHLDLEYIMKTSGDVLCTALPNAIDESQLVAKGIAGGSGRPLVTINGEQVEAVGMQMNVTPITFKIGDNPTYVLCHTSVEQINNTIKIAKKSLAAR